MMTAQEFVAELARYMEQKKLLGIEDNVDSLSIDEVKDVLEYLESQESQEIPA